MAMTLASPSASPSPATTTNVKNEAATNNNNNTTTNDNTTTSAPVDNTASTNNANAAANAAAANNANIKRKPSRRANTAERRATHNAVERQRRETLNGRFLDLAQLLPNLSQIRRPSKSSIVNSSIAHIHASRRHRMLASRELRQLRSEADALRREVNEWRSRQNLPLVDEPVRSDGFNIIVSGELDVLVAEMGAEMAAQGHGNLVGIGGNGLMDVEEDEDLDDWGPGPHSSHGGPPPPGSAGGYPGPGGQYDEEVFVAQPPVHPAHHGHHPAVHQGMMMNGHPQHHPQHHAQHPQHPMHPHHQQQHVQHPHHMAQGGHPFGYHPSQAGQFADEERYAKNNGNPFAHNINTRYDSPTGPGALFTPPATRDGLPPNGVAGLTSSTSNASSGSGKGGMNINTNVGGMVVNGGGASPAHSVQSVHSGHSPASHHSGIAMAGGLVNGSADGHTPPPPSAISQHFSARSGSGSPVGSYELASGGVGGAGGVQQPGMERRATYPGPAGGMMYAGPGAPQEMYGGHPGMPSHDMHPQQQQQRMQAHMGHDMREMRGHPMGHGEMRGHEMRGGHDMREMRGQQQQMVGAGAGGGLFGMML